MTVNINGIHARVSALETKERRRHVKISAATSQLPPPAMYIVGGQTATAFDYPVIKNITTEISTLGTAVLPNLSTFDPTDEDDALTLSYTDGLGIARNQAGDELYWIVNDSRSNTFAFGFGNIFVPVRSIILPHNTGPSASAWIGYC